MKHNVNRNLVLELKQKGLKHSEIMKATGFSKSKVTYYLNEEYRLKQIKNHKNRRINMKLKAIEYKGGKCCYCGYNLCPSALEFHHLNPSEKDRDFLKNMTAMTRIFNWEKIKLELDKCVLMCCRCHRELHGDYINLGVVNEIRTRS